MELNCGIGQSNSIIKGLVSVIIPTKNSAKTIHFALQGIDSQSYKNVEIIVVDNFSQDNTRDIARRYGAKVFVKGHERGEQLEYGVLRSHGEYLYFTGSDLVSDPSFILQSVNKCQEGCDAVYTSVVSKVSNSFWSRVKAFERKLYIGSSTESARFFTRKTFDLIGGIDTSLISIEEDLQHRLDRMKFKTGRINVAEIHLHEANTLEEVAEKSFYYGIFIKKYLRKYPVKGTAFLCPIRSAYLKNFVLLLEHPILSFGLIIYKIVQYYNGFLGMLSKEDKETVNRKIYEKNIINNASA